MTDKGPLLRQILKYLRYKNLAKCVQRSRLLARFIFLAVNLLAVGAQN